MMLEAGHTKSLLPNPACLFFSHVQFQINGTSTVKKMSPNDLLLFFEGTDMKTSPRRRAYSTNQIVDYNPLRKVHTPSDPSSVMGKNPLRRTKIQELTNYPSQAHGAQWMSDYQVSLLYI